MDSAERPARLAMKAAIGASSTGEPPERPSSVAAQGVDPAHLREQPPDLPDRQDGADQHDADDQRVEARIGEKRGKDLTIEDEGDEPRQNQKDRHADEINPRRRQRWAFHLRPLPENKGPNLTAPAGRIKRSGRGEGRSRTGSGGGRRPKGARRSYRAATRIAPSATSAMPAQLRAESSSPKNAVAKIATRTTLSLSTGATLAASPIWRARK